MRSFLDLRFDHRPYPRMLSQDIRLQLERDCATSIARTTVRSENHPEGCIVESYIAEEAVEFFSEYIGDAETIGVPNTCNTSNKGIRVGNPKFIECDDWELAHRIVLENTSLVQPYIQCVFDYVFFFNYFMKI